MRKNSPRKWLHAILDLLPLIILPIFALAVRSDNNFQPISIEYGENVPTIEYEYKYDTKEVNSNLDLLQDYIYFTDYLSIDDEFSGILIDEDYSSFTYKILYFESFNGASYLDSVDEVYFDFTEEFDSGYVTIQIFDDNTGYFNIFQNNAYICYSVDFNNYIFEFENCVIQLLEEDLIDVIIEHYGFRFTASPYNIITSANINYEFQGVVYNDTDVGSQMVYTLYNATDKYFNFNNVFNFGQIYDWFVLNIFNGNATLIFPVVWNIVLYEFVMDLVFLIYALFMFFIDFCTNLIDRFHVKSSGGK